MNSNQSSRRDTIEIRGDPMKLIGLLILGIIATSLCAMFTLQKIGDQPTTSFSYMIVSFGVPLFGLCTLIFAWRLLRVKEVMLRLSPEGIWIREWGGGLTIPWSSIDEISSLQVKSQKFLMLRVSSEKYAQLQRGYIASSLHKLNKLIVGDGIPLSASGLAVSFGQLDAVVTTYFKSLTASN